MQEQLKQQMLQCQVLYNNKPLEKVRHGKKMTLKDHDIKSSTTLVVTKPGITLSITDPKVSMTVVWNWHRITQKFGGRKLSLLCVKSS